MKNDFGKASTSHGASQTEPEMSLAETFEGLDPKLATEAFATQLLSMIFSEFLGNTQIPRNPDGTIDGHAAAILVNEAKLRSDARQRVEQTLYEMRHPDLTRFL